MAGKSDPSIYDDRTTIGSSDELDEYGVWVKSDNQDESDSLPDLSAPLSDNLELPDFDDIQDEFMPDINDDLDLPKLDDEPDLDTPLGDDELDLEGFDEITNFDDMSTGMDSDMDSDLPDFDGLEMENTIDGIDESNKLEFEEVSEEHDLPEGQAPIAIDKDGFTEISMDDFLGSVVVEEVDELPGGIDIGNLDSSIQDFVPAELDDEITGFSDPMPQTAANMDLSTALLQKIADELSSIKKEISSLKTELSAVRGSGQQKGSEPADNTGFFDEEDDEKISLTGDELDNILHTANFTEESGTDAGIDSGFPASDDSQEIAFEDDIGELDGAVKIEDEIKNFENDDFDISLDLTPDGETAPLEEVEQLWEDGIAPITEAPEDTSYLEEDPLAFEDEAINTDIDFSGAAIDEPDLSSGISENPVSEPAINDISIDMEMEDVSFDSPSTPGSSDDFIFETEEATLEIPEVISAEQGVVDSFEDVSIADFDDSDIQDVIEVDDVIQADDVIQVGAEEISSNLKQELKTILSYMDQLLESLPEEKIEEFAKSEYFDTYKKLFEELGLA